MDVRIVVSAERFEESQLAEIFEDFEGGHAVRRRISNQTALDESTINVLITGGFSTAAAMITAMATVWIAKVKSVVDPPKAILNSIYALTVVTNTDDVAITVSSDGRDIVSGAGLLPMLPDEVIELRFNSAQ
jgi:adenosylcobinamide amidohydrolase